VPKGADIVMLDNEAQVRPVAGFTEAVRAIVPVNEPVPVPVITEVPGAPALAVTLIGFAESVKPPAPVTVTVSMNVVVTTPPLVLLTPVKVTT
jgi:hypothetical protein